MWLKFCYSGVVKKKFHCAGTVGEGVIINVAKVKI